MERPSSGISTGESAVKQRDLSADVRGKIVTGKLLTVFQTRRISACTRDCGGSARARQVDY